MIRMAVERMGLSAQVYHRILKLSRTLAVLAGSEQGIWQRRYCTTYLGTKQIMNNRGYLQF